MPLCPTGATRPTEPDGDLLGRYLAGREPAALEALVRRHGPMVLGVCRRVLGHAHDAEDAFQATFLVFVRKAGTVRPRELVGPWLYGVATRTALKARAATARRKAREKQVDELPEVAAPAGPVVADALPRLDRAVQALPAKYRLPVVLCELQGLSRAAAAERLHLAEGTLSSRLARARTLLRRRLGLPGAAAALGAAVFPEAALAAVPEALIGSTVQAAAQFAAAPAASLATPAGALAKGVLTAMRMTTVSIAAALLLVVGLLCGAVGLLHGTDGKGGSSDRDRLQGTWRFVSVEFNGDPPPAAEMDEIKRTRFIVEGDKLTLKVEMPYKLDPTTAPKQIDLFPQYGEAKEKNLPIRAIYELNGDDLKLCGCEPGGERPTKFETTKGSRRMLFVMKRDVEAPPGGQDGTMK